jgi:hypothetical protein
MPKAKSVISDEEVPLVRKTKKPFKSIAIKTKPSKAPSPDPVKLDLPIPKAQPPMLQKVAKKKKSESTTALSPNVVGVILSAALSAMSKKPATGVVTKKKNATKPKTVRMKKTKQPKKKSGGKKEKVDTAKKSSKSKKA